MYFKSDLALILPLYLIKCGSWFFSVRSKIYLISTASICKLITVRNYAVTSNEDVLCVCVLESERVILTYRETLGERETGTRGCISYTRYLRARQSRFSVNLRVIPVISCLENHAVALMLHCLSFPSSTPLLWLLVEWRLYYFQSTPIILTMNQRFSSSLTIRKSTESYDSPLSTNQLIIIYE